MSSFSDQANDELVAWKLRTPTLDGLDCPKSPYSKMPKGPVYDVCLPLELADFNLSPDARVAGGGAERAVAATPWHQPPPRAWQLSPHELGFACGGGFVPLPVSYECAVPVDMPDVLVFAPSFAVGELPAGQAYPVEHPWGVRERDAVHAVADGFEFAVEGVGGPNDDAPRPRTVAFDGPGPRARTRLPGRRARDSRVPA